MAMTKLLKLFESSLTFYNRGSLTASTLKADSLKVKIYHITAIMKYQHSKYVKDIKPTEISI